MQEEWPDLGVSAQDAVSDSAPDLQALSMAGRVGEKPAKHMPRVTSP